VAQSHFRSELGGSVAAERPEVANLIEKSLAQEAIELLRLGISANANAKPPGFGLESGIIRVRLWTDDLKFKWPALGTLSAGYFVARHEIKIHNDWNAADMERERDHGHGDHRCAIEPMGLYQRGLWHAYKRTREDLAEAQHLFRQAIEIEPGLARAYAAAEETFFFKFVGGYVDAGMP
jgi:hypothetical protein